MTQGITADHYYMIVCDFCTFVFLLKRQSVIRIYHSLEECTIQDPYVTIGVFDGVHKGHQYLFRHLNQKADEKGLNPLVVTFWPHPRLILNGDAEKLRYLTTLREKAFLMEKHGIEHVLVFSFDERIRNLTACEFVEDILMDKIGAKGLLMGFNHRFGKNREGDFEHIQACVQTKDFVVDRVEAVSSGGHKISSTIIRDLLWGGDVSLAAELLGYHFFVTGMIVSGNKLGRNLGYPTANVQPFDKHKLLPRDGVYIARAEFSGKQFFGMVNIGIRPTFKSSVPKKTVEIHLFDFHGDIYGQDVRIFFLKRLRDEMAFSGPDGLQQQLKKDHHTSIKWLRENKLY